MENFLETVEALSTHADGFAECSGTDWADHELLECDRCVGVRATVDYIHHRHGEHLGIRATDVFVKWKTECICSSVCYSERDTEHGVCAELTLVWRAVDFE